MFISSPVLLAEIEEVIRCPKFQTVLFRSQTDPAQLLNELKRLAEIHDPLPLASPVSRDIDDDAVSALAVASQAELIVSGDADLLAIREYAAIPIVDCVTALARCGG